MLPDITTPTQGPSTRTLQGLEAMHVLLDAIYACDDYDRAMATFLGGLGSHLKADRAVFVRVDARQGIRVTHEYRANPEVASLLGVTFEDLGAGAEVLTSPDPVVLRDFSQVGLHNGTILRRGQVRSAIFGSVRFRGALLGVVLVHDCQAARDWSAEDQAWLKTCSTAVAAFLSAMRTTASVGRLMDRFQEALRDLTSSRLDLGIGAQGFLQDFRTAGAPDETVLATHFPDLSAREREVLLRLERPNKDIGRELFISEHTVKGHVGRILYKLGAKDRADAVQMLRAALGQEMGRSD